MGRNRSRSGKQGRYRSEHEIAVSLKTVQVLFELGAGEGRSANKLLLYPVAGKFPLIVRVVDSVEIITRRYQTPPVILVFWCVLVS